MSCSPDWRQDCRLSLFCLSDEFSSFEVASMLSAFLCVSKIPCGFLLRGVKIRAELTLFTFEFNAFFDLLIGANLEGGTSTLKPLDLALDGGKLFILLVCSALHVSKAILKPICFLLECSDPGFALGRRFL